MKDAVFKELMSAATEALEHARGAHGPMDDTITRGSGNVFLDIGFPPGEAARLKIRSSMMGLAKRIIEERGLTRKKTAAALGVTQARADDLINGRIDRFNIDSLIEMLTSLGVELSFMATVPRAKSA